jgi:hypothetical protein
LVKCSFLIKTAQKSGVFLTNPPEHHARTDVNAVALLRTDVGVHAFGRHSPHLDLTRGHDARANSHSAYHYIIVIIIIIIIIIMCSATHHTIQYI